MKISLNKIILFFLAAFTFLLFQNCQDLAPLPESTNQLGSNTNGAEELSDEEEEEDPDPIINSGVPLNAAGTTLNLAIEVVPGFDGFATDIQNIISTTDTAGFGLNPGGTSAPLGTAVISACAQLEFSDANSTAITLEYMSTPNLLGAACNPANMTTGCGFSPGLRVFDSIDGVNWRQLARAAPGEPAEANFKTIQATAAGPFQFLLICRAGGGVGAESILVRGLRLE